MLPKWYIDFVESRKWYLNDYNKYNIPGWWLSPTPLKNDGQLVSWDDDIPNIWKNNPMFQTTNKSFCCYIQWPL